MDLHRLQHVIALAETGHFGRAALRAHISQSALSRSIQAAEREFGLALFDRNGASVTPTRAGSFIIERARKLLFDSRCLMRDADLYRERQVGELAFGVGPYAAAVFLRPLLADLRGQFPKMQTRVEVSNTDALMLQLKAEELDFYVGDIRNIRTGGDIIVTPLAQLEAAFYVRQGHPLLSKPCVTPTMLLDYGVASVRAPLDVRITLGQVMGLEPGTPLPFAIELDDLSALKDIAMRSDTVIGCAVAATQEELDSQRLVTLHIPLMPKLFGIVGTVTLQGRSPSPMAQWAYEHLQHRAKLPLRGIVA